MEDNDRISQLEKWFKDPPAANRTAPLWVWNDLMTEESIDFQLQELKNHGFGGAFVHPRPGLITEYLSEDWFQKWGHALKTAKRLGMKLYIYDENSYPSGFAGGHIPSQLPDCLSTSVMYKIKSTLDLKKEGDSSRDWFANVNFLKAYVCEMQEGGSGIVSLKEDITNTPVEEWTRYGQWFMTLELQEPQAMSWLGDFANVDILRPEVTRAFLDSTYEAYYKRFGQDFGKDLPAIFSDEPAFTGSRIYNYGKKDNIPFSYWLAAQFEKRNGYSIIEHLPALLKNVQCDWFVKKPEKVRYDYFCTVRELWTKNFIQPVSEWCHDHGVAWTGHYLENCWPLATGEAVSPAIMANYEYHQWPAIDLLESFILRNEPTDLLLVTLLELRSVANQLGKERTLCETYGAGGWDSTLEDYKRIGDWLMVNGINFINQHLTYGTVVGARKRDHPQSFDWREPWWDEYKDLNDYTARVQTMLMQGKSVQRILVLHPTTTGFLMTPEEEASNLMWGQVPTNPDMRSYLKLLQYLTDRQWDFDLGDEYILERHAAAGDGRLTVGGQVYEVILVSGDMKNMRRSTLDILNRYSSSGGTVISMGKPGPYIDGEVAGDEYFGLLNAPKWKMVNDLSEVDDLLNRILVSHIHSTVPFPTGLAHMRREFGNGRTVYFFVNHSMEEFDSVLALEGHSVKRWNPWNGEQESIQYMQGEGSLQIPVRLKRNESLLLWVEQTELKHSKSGNETEIFKQQPALLPFTDFSITCEDPNTLTIDYCDLEADGMAYRNINAFEAGRLLFQHHGFKNNPWDNAIQFRRRVLDRNNFGDGSGFSVTYHFVVAEDWNDSPLQFIMERSEFYSLMVNGHPVQWIKGEHWLDHHNGVANIHPFVRKGKNTVTATANRFDILLEVEAAYLRGGFSVGKVDGEWVLGTAKTAVLGDWTEQGYPFYSGAFCYTYKLNIPESAARVTAELCTLETTACSLYVNGKRVGLVGMDGNKKTDLTPYIHSGQNEINYRICGSLKNLLGPHHDPEKPRRLAWPQLWRKAPRFGPPAAENYDLIGYGLYEHVRFEAYLNNGTQDTQGE